MDFHLALDSPCLGSGFHNTDMGSMSQGCEEPLVHEPVVLNVSQEFPIIREAVDASCDGDTIIVAPGTYHEFDISFLGRSITIKSTDPEDPDVVAATVVDGGSLGTVFSFFLGEGPESVLNGLTITGGFGNGLFGGGIFCSTSSPTIVNCTIRENSASSNGGGIACSNSSFPTIANCTITGNHAASRGGGVSCNEASSPTIEDCWIMGNSANTYGGGIDCYSASPMITNCLIKGNSTEHYGGGISCSSSSSPEITNCTIAESSTCTYGGGIFCSKSSPTLMNCTIAANRSDYGGGGIASIYYSVTTIINSILWGDRASEGPEIFLIYTDYPSTLTVSYSDVEGGNGAAYVEEGCTLNWLEGNIDEDPLFVGEGNYHLTGESPCIDAAIDEGVYHDIDGDARPQGAGFDMGADEFVSSEPCFVRSVI